jgi:hypothetical protein
MKILMAEMKEKDIILKGIDAFAIGLFESGWHVHRDKEKKMIGVSIFQAMLLSFIYNFLCPIRTDFSFSLGSQELGCE